MPPPSITKPTRNRVPHGDTREPPILREKEQPVYHEVVEEEVRRGKVQAREDMEEDGKIDDRVQISRLMAVQLVNSFNQNYDKRSVSFIEDLRKRSTSNFARNIVAEYDEYRQLVIDLKIRYEL